MDYFQQWKNETIAYLGGKCVHCGSTADLEFDHVDEASKSFSISSKWGMADKATLQAEIDKCQLLCKPCHKTKTDNYVKEVITPNREPFTHGTIYAWMRKKCRCEICLPAKDKWNDERNAKRRKPNGRVLERNTGSA